MANPEDNNNDNWKKAVDLLTGYVLPERKTLFDDLKGNDGIPLIHVRLDKHGGPEYSSGFLSSSGWKTHNTDYTIPFYRPATTPRTCPRASTSTGTAPTSPSSRPASPGRRAATT